MSRTLSTQRVKQWLTQGWATTHEGAAAYDYSVDQPLTHLTFTQGSALLTDAYYEGEAEQVRALAKALLGAAEVEPRFPWQYAAWIRDPVHGKGNRIQGSLAPALLDGLLPSDLRDEADVRRYTALALSHRPDDVTACLTHYHRLDLGQPSAAVRQAMADALSGFDEYQLMKYAGAKQDVRLCDVILMVQQELRDLGEAGALALAVGRYLHAPTRARRDHPSLPSLPITQARRALWAQPPDSVLSPRFPTQVQQARATWEQVVSHFTGEGPDQRRRQQAVWAALLDAPGLLPDMALLRNLRNIHEAGVPQESVSAVVAQRKFAKVWPHQVYAGYQRAPALAPQFELIFQRSLDRLPPGRHLGITDASGSMGVRAGGPKASLTAMDVALCLTALMSESSGLGASFSDDSWAEWSKGRNLSIAARAPGSSALAFTQDPALRAGMGGTQVFGAVVALIEWLKAHPEVQPPDCLWFFSDMQFHPADGELGPSHSGTQALAKAHGVSLSGPPLEAALRLYRAAIGPVDVVLWNLVAYSPIPVPADMEGVLLVSGFDTNTFSLVQRWREGQPLEQAAAPDDSADSQSVTLDTIRAY